MKIETEKLLREIFDDKGLVIICATLLGIVSMFASSVVNPVTIVSNIVTGLFGVAIGRRLNGYNK